VQSGNLPQPLDIVGDYGMVGADDGTKFADALGSAGNAFLVEVISEKIDAVRTGKIIQYIAVKIADSDAGRGCKDRASGEMLTNDAAVLKGNAIGRDELEVGNPRLDRGCQRAGPCESVLVE